MKKWTFLVLAVVLSVVSLALGETEDWMSAPVVTQAYEISEGKLYIEWEGCAPVYQVYMDGESVASVIVSNAVIGLEKGTHAINVYPINEVKSADTKLDFGLNGKLFGTDIGGNIGLDLGVLGLDPKKLAAGSPSETLNIDYIPDTIFNAEPNKLAAMTDFEDRVLLSFEDRYSADEYLVAIKAGKDVNYVRFNWNDPNSAELMTKQNTAVTLVLDQEYLQKQGCMIPELDNEYKLSVQLRKYADSMLNGENIVTVIHESKVSAEHVYTPIAAWKAAPVVTYASQTADGQITLQWTHDDNGLGCEYVVLKISRMLGIQTGEEVLGRTAGREYVIDDLMNGNYSIAIAPMIGEERGTVSVDANVEVKNEWVAAPALVCQQEGGTVRLSWMAAEGVEKYHITVYKGDNESLLRFVNLDFSQYAEYEIEASIGEMEYVFQYDGEIDPVNGEKLKFEIYGVRHTAAGEEQKTTVSSQMVIIRNGLEE